MKFQSLFLIICITVIISCSTDDSKEYDNRQITSNKFNDVELQNIYNLQNQRNGKSLLPYLNSEKAKYRDAAAMAFASIKDTGAVEALLSSLQNDKSVKVRISSAYAIGQSATPTAQKSLIDIYKSEKSDTVKLYIAEAIGKCGNTLGLDFLSKQFNNKKLSKLGEKAVFKGISRFFIRGIYLKNSLERLLNYIDSKEINSDNLYEASIALSRSNNNIKNYDKKLIQLYNNTDNIFIKLNIVNALAKNKYETALPFLSNIVNGNSDYRLKINAIRAFSNYKHEQIKPLLMKLLYDRNPNASIAASEFIIMYGNSNDIATYIKESEKVNEWRTRSNLLTAALKYSKNKNKISNIIKKRFNSAVNKYEKASLLNALGYDINNYKFVSSEIHKAKDYVVATYGMEAISAMCNNYDFKLINNRRMLQGKKDLKTEFAYILKDAIMSKDVSKIAIAAGIIRKSQLNFAKAYDNTYFLTQALNNCELPKDLEAYIELQKTIAFIKGNKIEEGNNKFKKAHIDWEQISQIPVNKLVTVKTSKGDITIKLRVNDTPVSVSNFLKLAKSKYFNNKYIHRVVPNFVIQGGCPRGDGWGSPDYTIYSELPVNYYTEGSVGMASAGKDTEASQWFITHSPTPHLDGNYTNFGQVVKGMDVVHKLQIGDKIIEVVF